jgi:hypothetical protein
MVLYHFVLWTVVPVPVLKRKGKEHLIQYALLSIAILAFFLAMTMGNFVSDFVKLTFWLGQFYIWSYIHITASFALSPAHPLWLVQLFRPSISST